MADDKWTDTWIREAYPPNLKICYSIEELENEIKTHSGAPITLGVPYHIFEPAENIGKSKSKIIWFRNLTEFGHKFLGRHNIRILVLMSFQRYLRN